MNTQTLTAFYDFEVSPIAFDFAVFAILAEMERERRGAQSIHFVFVPGANDGFRSDDIEYDSRNKEWRLRNIILPICSMLPVRTETTCCLTREHALDIEANLAAPAFPIDYTVAIPIGQFGWSSLTAAVARGEQLPSFRASPQAMDYMGKWLLAHTNGLKPVCITLRESTHYAARNSNIGAWLEFARWLDPQVYHPVFVRDTERTFEVPGAEFDALTVCPIASVNLELRMALYEQSWLCMMVLNGPGELCRLSNSIRYLFFDMVTEEIPGSTKIYHAAQGFKVDGNLSHATRFQRQIWEPDEFDILSREFSRIEEDIGTEDIPSTEAPYFENAEDPMEVAVRLQMTGRLEDATTIYQEIVQTEPDNADAWHMLGIIAHQTGQADPAEKLVLRAISLRDDQANFFITIAHILKDLARRDEALNALKRAVSLAPDDASALGDLAELLNESGDRAQAEAAMMQALKLAPDSVDLLERAATLLQDWGNSDEAVQFFRRALDVRKELERKQFEGDQRMSEIPRVTLTTG